MTGQEFSLLATGLWCIPLAVLALLFGVALLVRFWRLQTQQDMKRIHAELRDCEAQVRQAAADLQGYSPVDPEPYGSIAARLANQLQALQRQAHNLRIGYVAIQEDVHRLAVDRWKTLPRAPYEWYRLRGEVAGMGRELDKAHSMLETLDTGRQALNHLAWQTTLILRQAGDLHLKAGRSLERMQAKHVHGQSFEAALALASQARQVMDGLPRYFFIGSEDEITSQADRAGVIAVHEFNTRYVPLLAQLDAQVQAWEHGYTQAAEQVAGLRNSLVALEQGVAGAPQALALDDWSRDIQSFGVIAQALQATLIRLEVESLPQVAEQAAHTQQSIDALDRQLQQARQGQAALETALPELHDNLKAVSAQFSALGTSPIHPVVWELSSPRLTRLSQQVSAIGSLRKPRRPQQVEKDLQTTHQLNDECLQLAQYCQQIAQQHAQLLDLLASPEINQGLSWYREAEKLMAQVRAYHPENWPGTDRVDQLPGELASLKDGLENLAGVPASRPLPESQVELSLEDVRYLKENQQLLRQRLANVQNRLSEIQLLEGHTAEQLNRAQVTLNLLESLGRSNRFVQGVAARDVQRQQFSLQALQDELEHSERSTVDKKSRQVKAFTQQVEEQSNQWLDQLRQDTRVKTTALAASLSTLEQVARLDDPAVAEARRLVASGPSFDSAVKGQKSVYGLEQVGLELKRQCEYWEKCEAAQKALADVEKPVLEISRQVSGHRQKAQKQMDTALGLLRKPAGWLPVNLSLDAERRELDALEKQWQASHEEQTSAIQLVARLGGLSSRYQVLAEKIERATERTAREQADFENLDAEIEEQAERWRKLRGEYRDNPQASQEIRELLDSVEQETGRLKEQTRQGALSPEQAQQSLKKLSRRLRLAQVAVDDQHAVDINGRVIESKDSTYREI